MISARRLHSPGVTSVLKTNNTFVCTRKVINFIIELNDSKFLVDFEITPDETISRLTRQQFTLVVDIQPITCQHHINHQAINVHYMMNHQTTHVHKQELVYLRDIIVVHLFNISSIKR